MGLILGSHGIANKETRERFFISHRILMHISDYFDVLKLQPALRDAVESSVHGEPFMRMKAPTSPS